MDVNDSKPVDVIMSAQDYLALKQAVHEALTTAQSEAAELRKEVERLREGLGNISNGSCVEDWGHKPEKDFQDYADAVLANSDECLVVCPSCDGARYDVWGGVPDRDCTVCWGRGKITRAALKEPQHEG